LPAQSAPRRLLPLRFRRQPITAALFLGTAVLLFMALQLCQPRQELVVITP
jgi:hypothetical protein